MFGAQEQELPTVAPVTVTVSSAVLLAGIEGKSNDAVFFKPLSNSFLVVFGVKKRSVPLYSIAPFSGVVKLVPVVSFMGAEPAQIGDMHRIKITNLVHVILFISNRFGLSDSNTTKNKIVTI